MQNAMTVEINLSQLISLSKKHAVPLECENCGARTMHEPVERLFALDKYTVECEKCGQYAVAEWNGLDERRSAFDRVISLFRK